MLEEHHSHSHGYGHIQAHVRGSVAVTVLEYDPERLAFVMHVRSH